MKGISAWLIMLLFVSNSEAIGNRYAISSPDATINAFISTNADRHLTIEISRDGRAVLYPSPIGLVIDKSDFGCDAAIISSTEYTINENYPWNGNHSTAVNHCKGSEFEISTNNQIWHLNVRAYNDGVAFQYSYQKDGEILFHGESTELNFDAALHSKYMIHKFSEESKIYTGLISDINKRTMPPLLFFPEDRSEYIMVLEGGGFNFHGYSMMPSDQNNQGAETCSFKVDYAEASSGWKIEDEVNTAWKIICTVNSLNKLVNTDLVANVCPAPDPSLFPRGAREDWIKPGKSTWNWWARVSVDFNEQLKLVDLAAEMGADYHLVDIGWDYSWGDEKFSSYEYLEQLCDYAERKGIGIFVWKTSDVSFNLEQNKNNPNNKFLKMRDYDVPLDTLLMRQEVERIAKAGAKGIKLDYIQSENSKWKTYMKNFLRTCARHKLMVDFHGCAIPAGESRTYPNELTREAIWGGEKLRGGGGAKKMPTSHYIDQIFTRLIAGHADFTPGILNPENGAGYTHAMQLASAMLFTSPLLCWADHPELFLECNGLEIIKTCPTVWDETIVLDGTRLSSLAVFARRDGTDWYISGINGLAGDKQTYQLDLGFLSSNSYDGSLYIDDFEGGGPEIITEEKVVSKGDRLKFNMLPNGGFILRLIKTQKGYNN